MFLSPAHDRVAFSGTNIVNLKIVRAETSISTGIPPKQILAKLIDHTSYLSMYVFKLSFVIQRVIAFLLFQNN